LNALLGARLPCLTSLDLQRNLLDDTGAVLLADAPLLGQLRQLNLGNNDIGVAGIRTLARSPHAADLTTLQLGPGRGLGDGAAEALAESPYLRRLAHLDLSLWGGEHLTAAGLGRLAGSPNFESLETLSLNSQSLIRSDGVRALCASPRPSRLTALSLRYCGVGDEGLVALANCPGLGHLRSLNLATNAFRLGGIEALASSRCLGALRTLDLSSNRFGDVGAVALASSAGLTRLHHLTLTGCNIGAAGTAALAAAPHLPELRSLDLWLNPIGDIGAAALAKSSHLGSLRNLCVSFSGLSHLGFPSQQGIDALVARFGADVVRFQS
jgi:Leucine-rich repeat (LRR) protein